MLIEQHCGEILRTVSFKSLTSEEKERLIVLISHDIAMAAKASQSDIVRTLIDDELFGNSGAKYTLFGQSERSLSADQAAAHNAMAITASLCEDFVNGTHPGSVIFPLLLAEAERTSLSIEQMLDAATAGLKISMFLLDMYGKAVAEKGYRPTTVINTMSGAAALALAQGASSEEALAAMSAAAGMVQGLAFPFQEGTEEWFVQVPLVTHAASLACRNAKALYFRHTEFLSGERSLGRLLGVSMDADLPDNLSLTRIGVKRHPVNSFVQPVVEAVLRLQNVDSKLIEAVHVMVPPSFAAMPSLLNNGPLSSPNLGLLSIPISSALALIHKGLDFSDFRKANDEAVLALANKVKVEFHNQLSQYDVHVVVNTADGKQESVLKTSFFYPSLADELTWIQEQYNQPLPWVGKLIDWYNNR
ncbi:MmgE/PrpD family protein [Ktedonobacteria bacterium brp13]|nr:MmgE/PrpD family protein [Ktedonobacteria bacterium brp13]